MTTIDDYDVIKVDLPFSFDQDDDDGKFHFEDSKIIEKLFPEVEEGQLEKKKIIKEISFDEKDYTIELCKYSNRDVVKFYDTRYHLFFEEEAEE